MMYLPQPKILQNSVLQRKKTQANAKLAAVLQTKNITNIMRGV